jgi:hypothetical protein
MTALTNELSSLATLIVPLTKDMINLTNNTKYKTNDKMN